MFAIAWCESAREWPVIRQRQNTLDLHTQCRYVEWTREFVEAALVCIRPQIKAKDSGEMGPWQIRPNYFVHAWETWERRNGPAEHEPNLRDLNGQADTVAWVLDAFKGSINSPAVTSGEGRLGRCAAVHHYSTGWYDDLLTDPDWPAYRDRFLAGLEEWERAKGEDDE